MNKTRQVIMQRYRDGRDNQNEEQATTEGRDDEAVIWIVNILETFC